MRIVIEISNAPAPQAGAGFYEHIVTKTADELGIEADVERSAGRVERRDLETVAQLVAIGIPVIVEGAPAAVRLIEAVKAKLGSGEQVDWREDDAYR